MDNINEYKKEVETAFKTALESGRLSENKIDANYAGNYMYMGKTTDGKHDAFKHSLTRQYLPIEPENKGGK